MEWTNYAKTGENEGDEAKERMDETEKNRKQETEFTDKLENEAKVYPQLCSSYLRRLADVIH